MTRQMPSEPLPASVLFGRRGGMYVPRINSPVSRSRMNSRRGSGCSHSKEIATACRTRTFGSLVMSRSPSLCPSKRAACLRAFAINSSSVMCVCEVAERPGSGNGEHNAMKTRQHNSSRCLHPVVQCRLLPDDHCGLLGEWTINLRIAPRASLGIHEDTTAVFRRSKKKSHIGEVILRWREVGLLVHECVHAAHWLIARGGVEIDGDLYADPSHEEKVAHATTILVEALLPALNVQDQATASGRRR
jgi:hypothetical protein